MSRRSPPAAPAPPLLAAPINLQRLPESQSRDGDLDSSLASDKPVWLLRREQKGEGGQRAFAYFERARCDHQLVAGMGNAAGLRLGWAGCLQSVERNSSWQHVANACGRWGRQEKQQRQSSPGCMLQHATLLWLYRLYCQRCSWTLLSQLQVIRPLSLPLPAARRDWKIECQAQLKFCCCMLHVLHNCRSPHLEAGRSRSRWPPKPCAIWTDTLSYLHNVIDLPQCASALKVMRLHLSVDYDGCGEERGLYGSRCQWDGSFGWGLLGL